MKKGIDLKVLTLAIVGIVLILLCIGAIIRAASTGEGLDPGVASAVFALLGAMVAGALGTTAALDSNNKKQDVIEVDVNDYEQKKDDE